jgi:ABC-type branched-subunit amino acid transport system ATPase component
MGASGAGKTSLLNILSDRISLKNGDILKNEIYLNDTVRVNDDNFGRVSAYVMQDDILYQHFTPREALSFAANMKISNLSEEELQNRIDTLVKDLGLKNAQNTIIGSVLQKTISGGERKRTAIGVELITNPSLILLDEPTSGLDSFKAV